MQYQHGVPNPSYISPVLQVSFQWLCVALLTPGCSPKGEHTLTPVCPLQQGLELLCWEGEWGIWTLHFLHPPPPLPSALTPGSVRESGVVVGPAIKESGPFRCADGTARARVHLSISLRPSPSPRPQLQPAGEQPHLGVEAGEVNYCSPAPHAPHKMYLTVRRGDR